MNRKISEWTIYIDILATYVLGYKNSSEKIWKQQKTEFFVCFCYSDCEIYWVTKAC